MQNTNAKYVYDFGDEWEHSIELEDITHDKLTSMYPVCLAGERACPPEDCGGPYGYKNLLEILSDPTHESYEMMADWIGKEIDPERFNSGQVKFTDPKERWKYAFGK
jgi:hypothetical protein